MTPPISRNSLLSREMVRPETDETPLQSQVDSLVGGFVQQATDWRSLAAMMVGGMAYRMGRIGTLSVGVQNFEPLRRIASVGIGLGAEVTAFEMTNRSLSSLTGEIHANPNLWRWEGQGGVRQGFLNSLITFGTLKGAGHLAQGENAIVQHLLQDTGMVLGHQVSGTFGITDRPQGTLAEQFLHAEATNLQLSTGMALAHSVAPGIQGLERGLDLSLRSTEGGAPFPRLDEEASPLFATATLGGGTPRDRQIMGSASLFMNGTPRNGAEPPRSPREATPKLPVFPFQGTESFYSVIDSILKNLPSNCRCLLIDLNVKALNNLGRLAERLRDHSSLREIRIRYADGSLRWFLKEDGKVYDDKEEGASSSWFDQATPHRPEHLHHVGLETSWKPPEIAESLPDLLKRLRIEAGFDTFRAAVREAREKWGLHLDTGALSLYEADPTHFPTFENLFAFSRIYHADVRDLIYASNRTRYPDLDPKIWITPYYPLLIERGDLARLEHYQKTDRLHQSMGWVLFSSRKDPLRYRRIGELAKATELSTEQLSELEQNLHEPYLLTMRSVAKAYGIDESRLIRSINYTFHRDLIPTMKKVFRRDVIYIDPKSEDPEKIRYYAQHPQSLGYLVFKARKSLKGRPSNLDLSVQLERNTDYVADREWDRVQVTPSNLADWVWFFKKLGLNPANDLLPRLTAYGMTAESPRYLLAEAMDGMSQNELAERAGIKPDAIIEMNTSDPPGVAPETLLSLCRALPNLDSRFFRAMIPGAVRIFPELSGPSPRLSLSPEKIQQAYRIALGELLFAYRMDRQLSRVQLGKLLGVSEVPVKSIESAVTNIEEDAVLLRAASLLNIDPELLYLRYRPHLLELFPVVNPTTGEILSKRPAAPRNDSAHLRRKLRQLLQRRGISQAEDFARFLGWEEPSSVRRVLQAFPLSAEELLTLKSRFPELSAQEWYEHFHRSILVYFLGRKADGSVNYDLPEGFTWESSDPQNLFPRIQEAMRRRFPSATEAARQLELTFLSRPYQLRDVLKGRWREETIAQVANGLGLDRRLLFFYFRGEELKKILEADGSADSFKPFRSHIQIPRVIRSSTGEEYPFQLILPDLQAVLASENAEFPIGQRGPEPILIQVMKREEVQISNSFFDSGTPILHLQLKEGETRGVGVVMVEPDALNAFALDTHLAWGVAPPMAPGAGSIALEWLATQAALHGKEVKFLHIENYQILSILMRQELLDPETAIVEAARWEDKELSFYRVTETFPLSDTQALRRNMGPDFWNVRGQPHSRLLPR